MKKYVDEIRVYLRLNKHNEPEYEKFLFYRDYFTACFVRSKGKSRYVIIINAKVYTVDSLMSNAETFAVKNEKFVAVGTSDDIKKVYFRKNNRPKRKSCLSRILRSKCRFGRNPKL